MKKEDIKVGNFYKISLDLDQVGVRKIIKRCDCSQSCNFFTYETGEFDYDGEPIYEFALSAHVISPASSEEEFE